MLAFQKAFIQPSLALYSVPSPEAISSKDHSPLSASNNKHHCSVSSNDEVWLYEPVTKLCLQLLHSPPDGPTKPPNSNVALTMSVSHIEEIEHLMRNQAIHYKRHTQSPYVTLQFHDPDGHEWRITNQLSPYSSRALEMDIPPTIPQHQQQQRRHSKEPLVSSSSTSTSTSSSSSSSDRPVKSIAVLTSGGDAPGMNAALRAIVRVALNRKCSVYAVFEGYQGLIDGGHKMQPFQWNSVTGILGQGGTVIATARCRGFATREGRLEAAFNLISRGIDCLIAIGGDGTLTGAHAFRSEWPSLVDELQTRKRISTTLAMTHRHLSIVGLVGSIDNDFCGTDFTIGCVSALHRIVEAVDALTSTAMSHHRAFVIEVMGRHCGWLALMASIATGADWVFLPEAPPEHTWQENMCATLTQQRAGGRQYAIVIVSEGAIDSQGQPITSEQVKLAMEQSLGFDTRVTILGHVQRGGTACAFDRTMATLVAAEAIDALLMATHETPAVVIGVRENHVHRLDLQKAVAETRSVAEAFKARDFDRVLHLRGPDFMDAYATFMATAWNRQPNQLPSTTNDSFPTKETTLIAATSQFQAQAQAQTPLSLTLAIIHTGAPAAGMNPATRIAVRLALDHGHRVMGIYNGFRGLMEGDVRPLTRQSVDEWAAKGGSELGTNRTSPGDDFGLVAFQLQRCCVDALLVVGGFEAYSAVLQMSEARNAYPSFCIPMVCLPATVSNNVPGTEYSLGTDTALNAIVEACDRLKQSATSSRKRAFVVEVQGGMSGYLATVGGIAAGCACSYIPEEGLDLQTLSADIDFLVRSSKNKIEGRIVLRNENVSDLYTTEFISALFTQEAKGAFDSRPIVLGHLQQGGAPSPLDRVRGARLATLCVKFLEDHAIIASASSRMSQTTTAATTRGENIGINEKTTTAAAITLSNAEKMKHRDSVNLRIFTMTSESAAIIGLKGTHIVFTPVSELVSQTSMSLRRPKHQWWMALRPLLKLLSSDPSTSSWPKPEH